MKTVLFYVAFFLHVIVLQAQSSFPDILRSKLNIFNSILPDEKVYVQSDRTIYKPGDDIWMALWVTDGITKKVSPEQKTTSNGCNVEITK